MRYACVRSMLPTQRATNEIGRKPSRKEISPAMKAGSFRTSRCIATAVIHVTLGSLRLLYLYLLSLLVKVFNSTFGSSLFDTSVTLHPERACDILLQYMSSQRKNNDLLRFRHTSYLKHTKTIRFNARSDRFAICGGVMNQSRG